MLRKLIFSCFFFLDLVTSTPLNARNGFGGFTGESLRYAVQMLDQFNTSSINGAVGYDVAPFNIDNGNMVQLDFVVKKEEKENEAANEPKYEE